VPFRPPMRRWPSGQFSSALPGGPPRIPAVFQSSGLSTYFSSWSLYRKIWQRSQGRSRRRRCARNRVRLCRTSPFGVKKSISLRATRTADTRQATATASMGQSLRDFRQVELLPPSQSFAGRKVDVPLFRPGGTTRSTDRMGWRPIPAGRFQLEERARSVLVMITAMNAHAARNAHP